MADKQRDEGIDVVNAPADFFGDLYHGLLSSSWSLTFAAIAVLVIAVNLVFGLVFLLTGGVANARPGSFYDAFFFSVQTVGTIGYGAMYPTSLAAHLAVTAESIVALAVAAVTTGLVFSKFSMPTARVEFSRAAALSPIDTVPTLAIRIANQRRNYLVEAQLRLTLIRRERSLEGQTYYRMHELALVRDRTPALGRSWTVLHRVDMKSPLFGKTPEELVAEETELVVALTGIDGTSSQTIHARHVYDAKEIRFGARLADMLSETPAGRLQLDYAKFHDLADSAATPTFPYPAKTATPKDSSGDPTKNRDTL